MLHVDLMGKTRFIADKTHTDIVVDEYRAGPRRKRVDIENFCWCCNFVFSNNTCDYSVVEFLAKDYQQRIKRDNRGNVGKCPLFDQSSVQRSTNLPRQSSLVHIIESNVHDDDL